MNIIQSPLFLEFNTNAIGGSADLTSEQSFKCKSLDYEFFNIIGFLD